MGKIEKALISVSDKSGIIDFARSLSKFSIQFISTGGTSKILRDAGIAIMDVSDYTGYPEMLNGRVKTLHPKIHGGILGLRSNPDHVREMNQFNIECIDMIVVNLFPFNQVIADPDLEFKGVVDSIDIGGLAMLRSAAKNFENVTVIIDPSDYNAVVEDMRNNDGEVSVELNLNLAVKVFEATSQYDGIISKYLRQKFLQRV